MQKGKYGICLWFYAALAFVLALLGQTLLCGLLLGFVILAERNEWLTRQVIQGFLLALISPIVLAVFSIFDFFSKIPVIGVAFSVIFSVISSLVSLIVLVFCIIGVFNTAKEKDASIPVLSNLAARAFGVIQQKVYTQQPAGSQMGGQPFRNANSVPQQPSDPTNSSNSNPQ